MNTSPPPPSAGEDVRFHLHTVGALAHNVDKLQAGLHDVTAVVSRLVQDNNAHRDSLAKLADTFRNSMQEQSLDLRTVLAAEADARRADADRFEAALVKQRADHEAAMQRVLETILQQLAGALIKPLAAKIWEWFWPVAILSTAGWIALKFGLKLPSLGQ